MRLFYPDVIRLDIGLDRIVLEIGFILSFKFQVGVFGLSWLVPCAIVENT